MKKPTDERICRVCECTDGNCLSCIEAQGYPCHWVEDDLCSRCANKLSLKDRLACPECGAPAPSWAAECDVCGCVWD